jgi:tetratricopeptide (TPR) repeat protein
LADAAQFAGKAEAGGEWGDAAKWTQALSAAKRAEALLAQGDADPALRRTVARRVAELTDRRDAIESDRRLFAALEAARGGVFESVGWAEMDAAYGWAFRAAGLDIDATDATTAGACIRTRGRPVELTAALDAWADVRRRAGRPEADWRRLVAAARAADTDPWRDILRSKAAAEDNAAHEALRALADDTDRLDAQPPASLILLAAKLHETGDRVRAEAVLRRAWARFPNDFWVNFRMAEAPGMGWGGPNDVFPRPAEALRYLTAAVALRPESAMAHDYLGIALHAAGDLPAAAAAQREAIRLNVDDPWIHFHLGATLSDSGDMAGAAAEFRAAIRLKPDEAWHHSGLGNALKAMGELPGALIELREAARLKPDSDRMRDELARAEREIGNSTGAAPRAPRSDADRPR